MDYSRLISLYFIVLMNIMNDSKRTPAQGGHSENGFSKHEATPRTRFVSST